MRVQTRTSVPVRDQLRSMLAEEIARGSHASGGKLPAERELAAAYGTSRTLVRQAVSYLSGLGHRQIGFIGFPNSEKYVVYWQSLATLGLPYQPHFVEFLQLPDLQPSILSGYRAMQKLLGQGQLPTAIIATNDLVAYGMMEALATSGVSVPQQISVLGFDDLGQDAHPPLTTIRTDSAEVGRLAVRSLLNQIEDGAASQGRIAVPAELVIRTSTAPPCSAPPRRAAYRGGPK